MKKNKLKPYLINAFFTWSIDTNQTPIIEVFEHSNNKLPDGFFNNRFINLNIQPSATRNMVLGKEKIEFEARFSGQPFNVVIDYDSIKKIFNKEDGYGLEFNFQPINENQTNHQNDNLFQDPLSRIKPINKKPNLILIKND